MLTIIDGVTGVGRDEWASFDQVIDETLVSVSHEDFAAALMALGEAHDEMQRRHRQVAAEAATPVRPLRIVVRQATLALLDPSIYDYVAALAEQGRCVGVLVTLEVDQAVAETHRPRDQRVDALIHDGAQRNLVDVVLTHPTR